MYSQENDYWILWVYKTSWNNCDFFPSTLQKYTTNLIMSKMSGPFKEDIMSLFKKSKLSVYLSPVSTNISVEILFKCVYVCVCL